MYVVETYLFVFCSRGEQRNESLRDSQTPRQEGCMVDELVGAMVEDEDPCDQTGAVVAEGVPVYGRHGGGLLVRVEG